MQLEHFIREIELDQEQEYLALQCLIPGKESVLESTMFISDIVESDHVLPELKRMGVKYIGSFEDYQAYFVLKNSPHAEEICYKVSLNNDFSIFRLSDYEINRKNPDDESDVFNITEEDLRPDNSWFENFRLRYTNWEEAWWREVLQNSVDTCLEARDEHRRRGKILCEIHEYENSDAVIVRVEDNGMGMNKQILKKAFLTPGGSGKREQKASGKMPAGGLGKAKEMLFHAWPHWTVWTKTDDGPGMYVEAQYGPYMSGNLLKSEIRAKKSPGTIVTVTMKKDRCVKKMHLVNFIQLSSFPISVVYRKLNHKENGDIEVIEEELLEAKNKISGEPIISLERTGYSGTYEDNGSVWANVYHMPKARNFKTIIVRANGLYLFSASGQFDGIKGKVIIELKYKPRGYQWNEIEEEWGQLSPDGARKQGIEDYGPLEMLTESRDGLLYWKREQLNEFLDSLIKRPEVILKKKRKKNRLRAANRKKERVNIESLMEEVTPYDMLSNTADSIKRIEEIAKEDLINQLAEKVTSGDLRIVPGRPQDTNLSDFFSAGDNEKLKEMIKDPEFAEKFAIIVRGGEPTERTEIGRRIETNINIYEVMQAIEEVPACAIDTSIDEELYSLYKDILIPLIKDAESQGRRSNYTENVMKMLKWEPDFIFSDETEQPTPKAPPKFTPYEFGPKERQVAKFWIECIRLIYIIQGRSNMGLDVGFLFENQDSDSYEGEYISSPGDEEDANIGAFKAVLIAPGIISNANAWKHRYSLRNAKSLSAIVSIGFHEALHATLHLSEPDVDNSHNAKFASMLTDDMALAMEHYSAFNKLAKYCMKAHPIKTKGKRKVIAKDKPTSGGSFYKVKQLGKRGRPSTFTTLEQVLEVTDSNPEINYIVEACVWLSESYSGRQDCRHTVYRYRNAWYPHYYDDYGVDGYDLFEPDGGAFSNESLLSNFQKVYYREEEYLDPERFFDK
jgi:hypothetical protein